MQGSDVRYRPASYRRGHAHVPGKAIIKVILVAVCFVGNDHDVAVFGKHGIDRALLVRKEVLNGRETQSRPEPLAASSAGLRD